MSNQDVAVADWKKGLLQRRKEIKPRALGGSQEELIRTSFLNDKELPLVIQPAIRSVDLAAWLRDNLDFVQKSLLRHGGLLFRGFDVATTEDFGRITEATSVPLLNYQERSTPRHQVSGRLYTSTDFPADQRIFPHNELSYSKTWPRLICFFCVTPAEQGGETPIADIRRVTARIRPEIRRPFEEKGWMLVRNYNDGFGLSWQNAYNVETREELEAKLRSSDVAPEWKDGDRLRTRQVRPAIARHPKTGEVLWFNHLTFWHVSSLEPKLREDFLNEFGLEGLPYNTLYGDGTPIPDEVVAELREAYEAEAVSFRWQAGDFLMLDNMMTAHARSSFSGPRLILTAMGEAMSDRGLDRTEPS